MSFSLGMVVITPTAQGTLADANISPAALLTRHARCDWGDLCDEDKQANDAALKHGDRILSSYKVGDEKVWIITEYDRSVTTLLDPSDY